jgi:hypothetical protein
MGEALLVVTYSVAAFQANIGASFARNLAALTE